MGSGAAGAGADSAPPRDCTSESRSTIRFDAVVGSGIASRGLAGSDAGAFAATGSGAGASAATGSGAGNLVTTGSGVFTGSGTGAGVFAGSDALDLRRASRASFSMAARISAGTAMRRVGSFSMGSGSASFWPSMMTGPGDFDDFACLEAAAGSSACSATLRISTLQREHLTTSSPSSTRNDAGGTSRSQASQKYFTRSPFGWARAWHTLSARGSIARRPASARVPKARLAGSPPGDRIPPPWSPPGTRAPR